MMVVSVVAVIGITPVGSAAADPVSDLMVTNAGPETTTQDADVAYVVTARNLGPDPADAVTMTFAPVGTVGATFGSLQSSGPAMSCTTPGVGGTGAVTCTMTTMPVDASATFTVTLHVDAAAPRGDFLTYRAQVSPSSFPLSDPFDENDTATQSTLVGPVVAADVGVTLLAPEFAAPDTDLAYVIELQNGGPDPADTTTLTDMLPGDLTFGSLTQTSGPTFACSTPAVGAGGTISCAHPSMAAGAGAGFTLVVHVPAATSGAQHTNTAGVSWAAHDPNTENDAASTATTISDANLAATASGPLGVVAGASITYTLGLSNAGPDPAIAAALSDTLPEHTRFVSFVQTGGPTFVLATPAPGAAGTVTASRAFLAIGESAQFTLVVAVDLGTLGGTPIAHTVTASAAAGDRDTTDNSATGSTMAAPAAPDVTTVAPGSGPPGTAVGIDGTRLGQATAVSFGDVAASFTIDSSGHITAVAPAGVEGTVDVRVGNETGLSAASSSARFTFVSPPVPVAVATTAPVAGRRLICGRVPDLRRHTLRGARRILARDRCRVWLRFTGRARRPPSHVRRQSVKPGTPLYAGDRLVVALR